MPAASAPQPCTVLYGGTFDPVHNGHISVAHTACRQLGLAKLTLLPNATPPHRQPPEASAAHRLAMLRLAVADHPELEVSDLEMHTDNYSYTVDTLRALHRGGHEAIALVVGADSAATLPHWREAAALPSLAHLCVVARAGTHKREVVAVLRAMGWQPAPPAHHPAGTWQWLDSDAPAAAAHVRTALRAGASPHQCALLPPKVAHYIATHALYGCQSQSRA